MGLLEYARTSYPGISPNCLCLYMKSRLTAASSRDDYVPMELYFERQLKDAQEAEDAVVPEVASLPWRDYLCTPSKVNISMDTVNDYKFLVSSLSRLTMLLDEHDMDAVYGLMSASRPIDRAVFSRFVSAIQGSLVFVPVCNSSFSNRKRLIGKQRLPILKARLCKKTVMP